MSTEQLEYVYPYTATASDALARPYYNYGLGADAPAATVPELTPAQKTEVAKGSIMYFGGASLVGGLVAGGFVGKKGALYTGVVSGVVGAALGGAYYLYVKSQEKK